MGSKGQVGSQEGGRGLNTPPHGFLAQPQKVLDIRIRSFYYEIVFVACFCCTSRKDRESC
jgi:hypothetical protein